MSDESSSSNASSSSNNNNSNDDDNVKESWNQRANRFLTTGRLHLHAQVAAAVDATNAGLAAAQETAVTKIQAPVGRAWQQATAVQARAEAQMDYLHRHRHEYGGAAVGGTAATAGVLSRLRGRGTPRAVATALLTGGVAYVAVYEPVPVRKIPDLVRDQLASAFKK